MFHLGYTTSREQTDQGQPDTAQLNTLEIASKVYINVPLKISEECESRLKVPYFLYFLILYSQAVLKAAQKQIMPHFLIQLSFIKYVSLTVHRGPQNSFSSLFSCLYHSLPVS